MASENEIPDGYVAMEHAFAEYRDLLEKIATASDQTAAPKSPIVFSPYYTAWGEMMADMPFSLPAFVFLRGKKYLLRPQDWGLSTSRPYIPLTNPIGNPSSEPAPVEQGAGTPVFDAAKFRTWKLKRAKAHLVENLSLGMLDRAPVFVSNCTFRIF